jgi:hypothetical protein
MFTFSRYEASMIDSTVERQFSDTRELLSLWRTFYDYFVMAVKKDNITPEKEQQFLEIKSRIAMLHDSFMEALTHNQNIGQEVLNIISRAITLKHVGKQSTADVKKMEIEWHESYLLLNETIGMLEDKRNELANINETQYRAGRAADRAKQKAGNFLRSFYFRATVVTAAVLFATVGVQYLGIYDYDELGKVAALQTPYNWGKALVRKFHNPDSPWPSVEAWPRTPFTQWPEGVQKPEIQNGASRAEFLSKIPAPAMRPILEKATEYRKETSHKQNTNDVIIHTFFFPDTATAKQAMDEWAKANDSAQQRLRETVDFFRSYNIISAVEHSDRNVVNNMRTRVFNEPSLTETR